VTTCRTLGADDTRKLAAALGDLLKSRDVLLLVGDLGAGKTAFTQGLARALGVQEQVTSPTFMLARSYSGRLLLNHLDVYRLDHLLEAEDLGLAELIDDGRISFGDPADGEDLRLLTLRAVGPSWSTRLHAVDRAVEAWSC
jgi:tRNA threonylcarbamoyladenosine biosynthesis protein TsaE